MPTIIPIDDPADPRIDAYRNIRERDLSGRHGLFVVEGKVVIEKMLASASANPLSLLIAAHRVDRLASILAELPADVPVYAARQVVFDGIAGFPVHRGMLALASRPAPACSDELLGALPPVATVLFLSAIANHDNLGGIFRNAAAFGANAVLLDSECCDPLYRKAIRVSVGATILVPWSRLDRGDDVITLIERHGLTPLALTPLGRIALAELRPPARSALLLGAEGGGLAPALIERSLSVRIPMSEGFDSLNVATASGIALHHLSSRPDCEVVRRAPSVPE